MPVRLADLMREQRTIQVRVGDEVVTVTYRPGGITPQTEDRLEALGKDKRVGASLVALLVDTVVDWDITDDRGKALPVTESNLHRLPLRFLGDLVRAITEDMRPNPSSAGTSADT